MIFTLSDLIKQHFRKCSITPTSFLFSKILGFLLNSFWEDVGCACLELQTDLPRRLYMPGLPWVLLPLPSSPPPPPGYMSLLPVSSTAEAHMSSCNIRGNYVNWSIGFNPLRALFSSLFRFTQLKVHCSSHPSVLQAFIFSCASFGLGKHISCLILPWPQPLSCHCWVSSRSPEAPAL